MGTTLLRVFLVLICCLGAYYIIYDFFSSLSLAILGVFAGLLISLTVIFLEKRILNYPMRSIVGGCVGLIIGLIIANLFSYAFLFSLFGGQLPGLIAHILTNAIVGYIGLRVGTKKGEEFKLSDLVMFYKRRPPGESIKILDTNVIIDGRIADICETGFIEGTFIIPNFILLELQHIADSSDSIKRTRGRSGLDILERMQKQAGLDVRIVEQDFPKIKDVDAKLVALAKEMEAKVITNDFNLNKVAQLRGVSVLNINQLANALKPVVLPGEIMNVRILREGKESGQGVAYLDDGTMVVVDHAKNHVGKKVDVSVTSVLQTTAGRMIFSVLREEASSRIVQNLGY
ncbi:MAG: TRAM domain-containing protein [Thermodesulfobacteriota bacterium]|nr:TRAM domain-containing protein [Thermodesulfobacteriota bacterium]